MKRALILLALALALTACKGKNTVDVACPFLPRHEPAFWNAVAAEFEQIKSTSPHIVILLKEHRGMTIAIERCIDSLRISGKPKKKTNVKPR